MSESHVICGKCCGKGCDFCHKGWECDGPNCKKCKIFGELKYGKEIIERRESH